MNSEAPEIVSRQYHAVSLDKLYLLLEADPHQGLSQSEILRRLQIYGMNVLPEKKRRTWFAIFFSQFFSPLIYILIIAAIISYFIGEARDIVIILLVIILNAFIGAFQEGRVEHAMPFPLTPD